MTKIELQFRVTLISRDHFINFLVKICLIFIYYIHKKVCTSYFNIIQIISCEAFHSSMIITICIEKKYNFNLKKSVLIVIPITFKKSILTTLTILINLVLD